MMQSADKRLPLQTQGHGLRIVLSGLDGRLVAAAIELDHLQKMSVLPDDVSSVICHRGIRMHIGAVADSYSGGFASLGGQPFIFARSRKL
jgi:hypothetical protein